MGKQSRERRKAKQRARDRARGRGPFVDPGPSSFGTFEEPVPPPPLTPDLVAAHVADIACGHAHGDPGVLADRIARLQRLPGARPSTVERGVELAGFRALAQLWAHGWLPVDVTEHARRKVGRSAQELLTDLVAAQVEEYAAAALHPRWRDSLHRAGAGPDRTPRGPVLARWAERQQVDRGESLTTAVELLAMMHVCPVLSEIVPPPGSRAASRAANRTDLASGADPKVLARVRALLAKAESTAFAEEAEAFSAKASELMNRHALEQALVEADQPGQAATGAVRLWLDSPYVAAKSLLVNTVAEANRCRSVSLEDLEVVTVVGHERDLEAVELLVTSLLVQANRAMLQEGRRTAAGGRARSRSFRQSFLLAYAGRIGERLRGAEAAASSAIDDERLLPVLAERASAVDDEFTALFPNTVQRSYSIGDAAGWQAGRVAADGARLGLDRDRLSTAAHTDGAA